MNTILKKLPLRLLVVIPGIAAMITRFALYLVGTDEKGLLITGHPLSILLWLLTAAAVGITLAGVWTRKGGRRFALNFPVSRGAGAGCLIFAVGILLVVVLNRTSAGLLNTLCRLAGLLSVPALACVSICRVRGKRPNFCFHMVVCLFLGLYTISNYQNWSSHPQLQNAVFPMLGSILLMVYAYQQTAFDVGMGSRRMLLGSGLLGGFACLAAIPICPDVFLYLTGAIWALTNLCSLTGEQPREEAGQ